MLTGGSQPFSPFTPLYRRFIDTTSEPLFTVLRERQAPIGGYGSLIVRSVAPRGTLAVLLLKVQTALTFSVPRCVYGLPQKSPRLPQHICHKADIGSIHFHFLLCTADSPLFTDPSTFYIDSLGFNEAVALVSLVMSTISVVANLDCLCMQITGADSFGVRSSPAWS